MIRTAIYCAALVFSKACVIIPLIDIFSPMERGSSFWGLWGFLALITLVYTAGMSVILCACNPRVETWNSIITKDSCISVSAAWLVSSIFNTVTDVFIIILPLFNIGHLHTIFKQKLGISVLFTTTLL